MQPRPIGTIQEAARLALAAQDAVNLSAVVHEFSNIQSVLWDEARKHGYGTAWVAQHAITTIFLDKLCSLNGLVTDSNRVHLAFSECRAIVEGRSEPTEFGISLTEVLVVLAVILTLFAIGAPVLVYAL